MLLSAQLHVARQLAVKLCTYATPCCLNATKLPVNDTPMRLPDAEPDIATPKDGSLSPVEALRRQFSDADARDLRKRHQELAEQARARHGLL